VNPRFSKKVTGMGSHSDSEPNANDLLWEVGPISAEVGLSERRTFYLLEKGLLPGRKIGRKWVSSRAALREALAMPLARKAG